jgi:hypothetical protein
VIAIDLAERLHKVLMEPRKQKDTCRMRDYSRGSRPIFSASQS